MIRCEKAGSVDDGYMAARNDAEKLQDNYNALMSAIIRAKPAAAKGQYIRSCVTATTMGPGIKINAQKQL